MRFRKRLEKLERNSGRGREAIVHFANGAKVVFAGKVADPGRFIRCISDTEDPDMAECREILRKAVRIEEPFGEHLLQLARAILLSPTNDHGLAE